MATNKVRKNLLYILLATLLAGGGLWFASQWWSGPAIRHVILISLDTCRADYLSCYGYARSTTPHIDALARQGYLFSHAMTPVPLTLPAHTSMMTGTIPPHHGKHENKDAYFDPSHVTLAALLKTRGYHTAAFVGAQVLNGRFGLDRGFDTYQDRFARRGDSERRAEEVNQAAFAWMEKQKENPVFLFLHYFDPHDDYDPPEPFATTFKESPYAGEIAYTDHCIGQVIDKLKSLEMYESSLIIVTGDHGEMLGEHGELTHMFFIYQSALKVPMIFKIPESIEAHRIDDLVGIIDIVPTVCELLDIDPPSPIQGKSLAGYFCNDPPEPEDRYLYCESLFPSKYKANSLLGLAGKRWKYIQTTRPELYDLQKDSGEQANLVEQDPHRARVLQDRLAQLLEETVRQEDSTQDAPLDAELLRHLSSLGYVSHASVDTDFSFDKDKEDPKDLIEFHNAARKVSHLVDDKKFAEAEALIEDLLKQRTQFGLYELGTRVALERRKYEEAIRYGEKAISLKPDRFRVHCNLGLAYSRTRRDEAAIKHFELALDSMQRQAPSLAEQARVRNLLAWRLVTCANEAIRDPSRALELAREACDLTQSKNPQYLYTLAAAHSSLENYGEAVKAAERALALARTRGTPKLVANLQKQLDRYRRALAAARVGTTE